jgi:hypothetical protein
MSMSRNPPTHERPNKSRFFSIIWENVQLPVPGAFQPRNIEIVAKHNVVRSEDVFCNTRNWTVFYRFRFTDHRKDGKQ